MIDVEALRRTALVELEGALAEAVRTARVTAAERLESWPGIGERRMITLTLLLGAAELAELSFVVFSYDRVLRAFAAAMTGQDALADLFVHYARPFESSAYRGAAPTAGGALLHEVEVFLARYQSARGAPKRLLVRLDQTGTLVAEVPRELRRGLSEIATAFQTPVRFVYARES